MQRQFCAVLITCLLVALSGCGAGPGKIPISLSLSPSTSMVTAGATQQFTATVTGTSNTAVTWSVPDCNTACGSISAAGLYTAPSPIPTAATVTVVATSQADSTKSARAAISQVPVVVSVSPSTVSLNAATTQQFTATVTGTSNSAVAWSISGCSTNCGTISSSGLYTAPSPIPSPATLTVVATSNADATKSANATVNHVPVAVAITPADAQHIHEGDTIQFAAQVSGSSNPTVAWSLSNSTLADPGTISTGGLYTAPSSVASEGSVTVTATSQADNVKTASTVVWVSPRPPITVAITPSGPLSLKVGTTQDFTATVQNDPHNAGVTWSLGAACTGTTCGTLTNVTAGSVKYTAPAAVPDPATVTLIATSASDSSKSASITITIQSVPLLASGDYVFVFTGSELASLYSMPTRELIAGRFHVDGNGNLTNGVEDINSTSGVSLSVPFTGTYTVAPDRTGGFTVSTTASTVTYRMTVDPTGTKATFIRFDESWWVDGVGSGYFELQNSSAFSQPALAGDYALGLSGMLQDRARIAAIGRMTVNSSGIFSNGTVDARAPESLYSTLGLSGSLNAPSSSTGRGTATLTLTPSPAAFSGTINLVYYVISANKLVVIQSDVRGDNVPVLGGEIQRQSWANAAASFNAPVIFHMRGSQGQVQAAAVGQISPDGAGALTGILDQNMASSITLNQSFTGTYTMNANGRVALTLPNVGDAIAYFFDENEGYLMQSSGASVLFGGFIRQVAGPYDPGSLKTTYRITEHPPVSPFSECDAGLVTFDGVNSYAGKQDYSFITEDWFSGYLVTLSSQEISGTYSLSANGRGQLNTNGYPLAIWAISPGEVVGINTVSPNDSLPVVFHLVK